MAEDHSKLRYLLVVLLLEVGAHNIPLYPKVVLEYLQRAPQAIRYHVYVQFPARVIDVNVGDHHARESPEWSNLQNLLLK